jgi:acyl-CoA synthetase (AMP-forming)/AMP-acid ligase II
VLIFYPMSAELYAALLALFRLGLVAMFLDPGAGREHIERCCTLNPPRALIAGTRAQFLCLMSRALGRIPRKFVIGWPLPGLRRWSAHEHLEPHADILDCGPDTPALLTFTSGSTGRPKGALRTHGFLLRQHEILARSFRLQPEAVDLTTLPIVLLANLASGLTSVIPDADLRYPGAVRPGPILDQVERHGVTRSVASPAFFECLARGAGGRTLPRFEQVYTGGAAVFPRTLEEIHSLAPGADVVAVYGSTEAEPIAHVSRNDITAADVGAMLSGRGLLAGAPINEIELRVVPDRWGTPLGLYSAEQFRALCLESDRPGEIVVTGEHVLKGYLQGRGDEETKFRVGGATWHRTGDAGYLDAQGRLWLLGRCAARIQDGRGELYPFAVEAAVYHDTGVRRAALAAHGGRRVLAVECLDASHAADPQRLRQEVAWAGIDEVRVFRHIPVDKRHNAKIDYPALRRMLERG